MKNLSQSILVFLVLVGGVLLIFFAQRPHSVCDSQIELFMEAQKGQIYPQDIKGQKRAPLYRKYLDGCRMGNSPGACYELFGLLKKVMRELDSAPSQCLPAMAEVEKLKAIMGDSLDLMVQLAWGHQPPVAQGTAKFAWLETSDLALFCDLRRKYIKIYGEDSFESLRQAIQARLPGETVVIRDGVCVNCENQKLAVETLGPDEVWLRSLFSARCDQY